MSYNHIEPQSLNDHNYDYKPNYMKKIYIKKKKKKKKKIKKKKIKKEKIKHYKIALRFWCQRGGN